MNSLQKDYLTDKNVMYLVNTLEFKKSSKIENKDFLIGLFRMMYDELSKK